MVAKKIEKIGAKQRALSSMAGNGLPESPDFRRWVEAALLDKYGPGVPVLATWNGGFRFRGANGKIYQQAATKVDGQHALVGPPIEVPPEALPQQHPSTWFPADLRQRIEAEVRSAFKDPASVHVTAVAHDHFDFVLGGKTYRQAIKPDGDGVSFEDFAQEIL